MSRPDMAAFYVIGNYSGHTPDLPPLCDKQRPVLVCKVFRFNNIENVSARHHTADIIRIAVRESNKDIHLNRVQDPNKFDDAQTLLLVRKLC